MTNLALVALVVETRLVALVTLLSHPIALTLKTDTIVAIRCHSSGTAVAILLYSALAASTAPPPADPSGGAAVAGVAFCASDTVTAATAVGRSNGVGVVRVAAAMNIDTALAAAALSSRVAATQFAVRACERRGACVALDSCPASLALTNAFRLSSVGAVGTGAAVVFY